VIKGFKDFISEGYEPVNTMTPKHGQRTVLKNGQHEHVVHEDKAKEFEAQMAKEGHRVEGYSKVSYKMYTAITTPTK
jgi:hypothetical protein